MKLTINLPGTPSRASEVLIGEGTPAELPAMLAGRLGSRAAYWIWDERVWELWHERVEGYGWPPMESGRLILFPASEMNKRLNSLENLAQQMVRLGADRQSALVAVGGGVTGDVVGFLASIYMRGIPHLQIPTSLLAQVDSSIGGKTGVDLPEGKNLLGSFHQPQTIWMYPQFLETLPPEEFRQGMAEVIKSAMLGDRALWEDLEKHTEAIKRREGDVLLRVIGASCAIKAGVVEADERESGYRMVLNLGHTVGHAVEKVSDYQVRHGDAVAMGLVTAANLAARLGKLAYDDVSRLEKLCIAWDLPVRIPGPCSPESLLAAIQSDKKRMRGTLHFVLPVKIGEVMVYDRLDPEELKQVLLALRTEA
jgi:3-dehydroquinate synthase